MDCKEPFIWHAGYSHTHYIYNVHSILKQ
jgi:hypothetical protein